MERVLSSITPQWNVARWRGVPLWGLAHLIIRQPWNGCLALALIRIASARQPFHG
ncbi:MAG: hypothetical protein ACI391_01265 [Muribaculaceae bacterium]